ncbi:hypothetical protein [Donghicola sp. XS_ASV15]|uniref:rhamnosyltransferase WsaF family glycosyltransferase n=1 Tax=Donghicola sp. XS_ASV15 TaxID=3241295 RepID=UPI003516B77E
MPANNNKLFKAPLTISDLLDVEFYSNALKSDNVFQLKEAYDSYKADGWKLGCQPSAYFDGAWYIQVNQDVASSGISPLEHYLSFGQFEGRRPNAKAEHTQRLSEEGKALYAKVAPYVDRSAYFETLSADHLAEATDLDPVLHYISFGHTQGKVLTDRFDAQYYKATNRDVREAGVDPLTHYLEFGYLEGRKPHPQKPWLLPPYDQLMRAGMIRMHLDPEVYRREFPEVEGTTTDITHHYIRFGVSNRFKPNSWFDPFAPSVNLGSELDHLTPLERHLIATGQIPLLPCHRHTSVTAGYYANQKLVHLLPHEDWDEVRGRNGFDVEALRLFGDQQTFSSEDLALPSIQSDRASSLEAENPRDEAFIKLLLSEGKNKVLSCDIWDTVLRRSCQPDETKLRAARALWLRSRNVNLDLAKLHPVDVMQMRRTAEAIASDEVYEFRFEDMSKVWLSLLQLSESEFEASVKKTEIAIEKSASYPDATVQAILEGFPGRKIAISDFYLGKEDLKAILYNNDLPEFDQVYVSCDHLATKRSGDLYDTVLMRENAEADGIFHIGDRFQADVQEARKHGLNAELFSVPAHNQRIAALDKAYYGHLAGNFTEHARNLAQLVGFDESEATCPASALAIVFGGFVLNIIEEAEKIGTDRIFFFSREGAFFKELYELAVKLDVYDLGSYADSQMLYVSRRATFAASLADLTPEYLMRLWSQYSTQSVQALAVTLNIDPKVWEKAATRHGIKLDVPVKYPWQNDKVIDFLNDPEVRDSGRQSIWKQRAALVDYLEGAGFDPKAEDKRLIVDIGWRGSIQDNIALVSNGEVHGNYLGLSPFLNPQPAGCTKIGYLFDAQRGEQEAINEFAALEFLSNALGGSVIGYEKCEPLREVFASEEACIADHVVPLQKELLASAKKVFEYIRRHGLVSSDLRQLANLIAERFMTSPEFRVADAFAALEHNETFGTGELDTMNEEVSTVLDETLPDYEMHYHTANGLFDRRWPSSFLNSKEYASLYDELSVHQRLAMSRPGGVAAVPAELRGNKHKIAVYAPHPIWGSGGHRTIYNLVKALSRAGHEVHLLSEGRGDQYGYVEQETENSAAILHDHWQVDIKPDAAIATIMHSAEFLNKKYDEDVKKFYLVQDNEAEFNMLSDGYVIGENSFAQGLNHLCVGHWLPHLIQSRFGGMAIGAGLGVDTTVYRPFEDIKRRKRVAVLFQPDKPRRMPRISLEALALVKQKHPDLEIVTYGSAPRPDLPFEFEHLGMVNDISHLNGLYNSAQIGLCISLTNPSRIPFEMMAAGCVPVDVYRYNNLFDYADGTALLAYQSAHSLAAAFDHLLSDPEALAARSDKGVEIAKMRSLQWETDIHVNAVEAVLRGETLDDVTLPSLSYSDPAFVSIEDDTNAVQRFLAWQRENANAHTFTAYQPISMSLGPRQLNAV